MNIHSGQLRSSRTASRGENSRVWSKMRLVFKAGFFFVVAAALFNMNIYLRQRISETDRSIRKIEREIVETDRDLERLRTEYAELTSWPQIRSRIAELGLSLSAPRPGQIREIRSRTPMRAHRIAAR